MKHKIAIDAGTPRLNGISQTEWQARVELAACYRIFAHIGWVEMIYNHITLKVPDEDGHFLINPFGLHYTEVTASNLLKINLKGEILSPSDYIVNPAGLAPHAAIHAARKNAHCIMHTHTTAGLAVACLKAGLSFTNFYAAQLHNKLAYHDFEGITVEEDEGPRLVRDLGDKPAMILRNHGLLVAGETLPQAFAYLWTLQRACEVQLACQSTGQALTPIPESVLEQATRVSLQFNPQYGAGVDVFNALVRQIDKVDSGYRL